MIPSLSAWPVGDRPNLVVVFTDLVGSTAYRIRVGDESMRPLLRSHFARGRALLRQTGGREVNTMGDAFLAAFRSVDRALDFVLALRSDPGLPLEVRAAIHVGPVQVDEDDVFGSAVNFAARVVAAIREPEIGMSARAMEDLSQIRPARFAGLVWEPRDVQLKDFGARTIWLLRTADETAAA